MQPNAHPVQPNSNFLPQRSVSVRYAGWAGRGADAVLRSQSCPSLQILYPQNHALTRGIYRFRASRGRYIHIRPILDPMNGTPAIPFSASLLQLQGAEMPGASPEALQLLSTVKVLLAAGERVVVSDVHGQRWEAYLGEDRKLRYKVTQRPAALDRPIGDSGRHVVLDVEGGEANPAVRRTLRTLNESVEQSDKAPARESRKIGS
jgi:hypothetical protein